MGASRPQLPYEPFSSYIVRTRHHDLTRFSAGSRACKRRSKVEPTPGIYRSP